ncbi:dimethyladenosine transferase [Owenweeksia hongkongensis DSM 17368]|uniref:Ribosomal RNA small subunit methyltransferase A n=1 Tax=Owenweeksia hongkongensis (strain DSM 17368 / CIP 108786 / JCM 12287 / NRRL B-23963 / UST20020801) TaxID=926562 RepID=G8R5X5_OWEHD|nr:16S rRNA (adenine(1518)-N(6)/adenine(1519)-N(6))-dimethyltransferase RsmA [Owenweeksia hongkongensis]AEV31123.1 dimethyladenosine transferase [Owenweeksia hongkongensis DSM 17368]
MIRPKKHLGQHFLKNEAIAADIANSLVEGDYNTVVEIGPGMGVLTQFLVKGDKDLYVVELDDESVEYLKGHFNMRYDHIIEGDFLKLKLDKVFDGNIAVIGNFPYNISSQIVFKIIENRHMIPQMAGMFQKEVAERIAAGPGSKTYGIISVLTAAYYDTEYLFTVEKEEFNPPPKVQSGVIRLVRKEGYTLPCDESLFKTVVKTAFNQRRKTLRNALKQLNLPEELQQSELMAKRAEQLHLEDFIYITKTLQQP